MVILSVDIDSLFECNTYAKHTNFEINNNHIWDIIYYLEQTKEYDIDTKINNDCLLKVSDILKAKCSNAKVRLIEEHDEIINVMEDNKCKGATVYNIDFHHDINYGNDNTELNIEDWTLHGKAKGLISDYHWICREMSELTCDSPFRYNRTCLSDVIIDNMKDVDMVVICISKQFTPKKYWNIIPNVLCNSLYPQLKYFKEVWKESISNTIFDNADEYLIDGTLPNIERVFRYNNCYIIYEKDENSLSIINKGKGFAINCCKEVVDLIIQEYGYCSFTWLKGIRNEVLINRLLTNYKIINKEEDNLIMKVKFKESDN